MKSWKKIIKLPWRNNMRLEYDAGDNELRITLGRTSSIFVLNSKGDSYCPVRSKRIAISLPEER
jgi:hypothetical protein